MKKSSINLIDKTLIADIVGEDAVAEILLDYQLSLTDALQLISTAITSNSGKIIASECHKLKSSSRFIGASDIADIFEQLEQQAKNNSDDCRQCQNYFQTLIEMSNSINSEIIAISIKR